MNAAFENEIPSAGVHYKIGFVYSPLPPLKNHPSNPIGFVYSPLWKITHQKPSVLCTPPFEKSPIKAHRFCVLPPLKNYPSKPIGFVYSPLGKITHQHPSVLCTPPLEKSPIKVHRFCVLPPLKNHPSKLTGFVNSPLRFLFIGASGEHASAYVTSPSHQSKLVSSLVRTVRILLTTMKNAPPSIYQPEGVLLLRHVLQSVLDGRTKTTHKKSQRIVNDIIFTINFAVNANPTLVAITQESIMALLLRLLHLPHAIDHLKSHASPQCFARCAFVAVAIWIAGSDDAERAFILGQGPDRLVLVESTNFQASENFSINKIYRKGGGGESLPLERVWSSIVAKSCVIFAYFKSTHEPNLV